MPDRSLPRCQDEKAGNVPIRIRGAEQTGSVQARLTILAQKMQQLFDEKARHRAHRPEGAGKHKH
jgi:hypothetical protein